MPSQPDEWQPVGFAMALDVDDGRLILRLSGDADGAIATAIADLLHDAVLKDAEQRDVDIVLDAVTYLDTRVVGVLLGISHELRKEGRSLRLVEPSSSATRMLGLLGLDRVLDVRER